MVQSLQASTRWANWAHCLCNYTDGEGARWLEVFGMGNSQRGFIRQLNRKEVTEALHTEAVSWKPPLWENREYHKRVLEWRRLWSSHCLFTGNYLENQLQVPVNSLVKGKQHPYEFPSVFSSFFVLSGTWMLQHGIKVHGSWHTSSRTSIILSKPWFVRPWHTLISEDFMI